MAGKNLGTGADPAWFWNRYWHSDRIASCFGAGGRNYRSEIVSGWAGFFGGLPDGATILDVCTGNGAIALIAAETAHKTGRSFTIHAIDQADIDPKRFLQSAPAALEQIRFRGGTPAEAIDLPDGCCDVICGQYGLEYTDRARTIAEVSRLIKPGGSLRFIVHAAEGSVVRSARLQIEDARLILERTDFFNLARKWLLAAFEAEATAGVAAVDAAYRRVAEARQTFEAALSQLQQRAQVSPEREMFENVIGILTQAVVHYRRLPWERILRKVDSLETEVSAFRARLEAMVSAAMTEDETREIAKQLSTATGMRLHVNPVRAPPSDRLLGWEVISGDH